MQSKKYKYFQNKKAYSVVIALFMIGFLLVVTSGIFNLVIREMKDNKGMGNYLKAYAGAEGAQELALLQIKKNGYGFYDKIDHNKNNRSIILSKNPLDISKFNNQKDVFVSYEIQSKTSAFSGFIDPLGYSISPLFYSDETGYYNSNQISLDVLSGNSSDLVWNIIGGNSGISGTGAFTKDSLGVERKLNGSSLTYSQTKIETFLTKTENLVSYLILFNSNNTNNINYKLYGISPSNLFTKPQALIISSSEIGGYKQNLKTTLDNTEYLNILKYSIFSK
ncbi:hypothetical protein CSA08_01770 [Candidatus Gracilibacteria bacterium]|nr:MAG: hypothetical protein CSA08_01770 [Candidatus Gracilibacteria bacterium]